MTTPLDIDAALLTDADKASERRILALRVLANLPGPDYATAVLANNPVVYWRFGEATGSTVVVDSSGNGHPGTYAGAGATLEQPGLVFGSDTAAAFSGTTGAAIATDGFGTLGSGLVTSSWEFWLKTTDTSASEPLNMGGPGDGSVLMDYDPATSKISVTLVDSSTGDVEGHVTFTLHDGVPHHVVLVVTSATTFGVYVDGVSRTVTYTSQVPLAAPNDFTGAYSQIPYGFTGVLDEFAAYDVRLSDGQILAHYTAATTRPLPSLETLASNAATITAMRDSLTNAKSLIDSLAQIAP